jgi:uncharacterized protein
MKKILVLFFCFFSALLRAQESKISVVTDVKENAIRLKWFLKDFDQVQALINFGYVIERAEIQASMKPEMASFYGEEKFTFMSKKSALQRVTLEDTISAENRAVLDAFVAKSPVKDKTAKDYAFALFSLQNAISSDLAKIAGLGYTDVQFDKNKVYAYRISIKGIEPFYVRVDASKPTFYPKIENSTLNLDRKYTVNLEWNAKNYTDYGFAFLIEKSLDQPKEGSFLTERPYAPVKSDTEKEGKLDSYRDNDLTEGKFHYYRLTGLNYFGEPAMYSEWMKIYIPKHVNAEIFIDSIYVQSDTRVVEGMAISTGNGKLNIDKFILEKSKFRNKDFEQVSEQVFVDTNFRFIFPLKGTGDQFYYRVTAISIDKDSVFSNADYFFTLDQEPPSAPIMKSGKVDSSGMVKLLWTPPSDKDLKGFRIFRANALNEEFQEVNKELSPASAFIDQVRLDNLTSELYYFVRAVDQNYNNSKNSDTILVLKPDTIPPVAAFLYKPTSKDSLLHLSWSNSNNTDVFQNFLIRQSEDGVIDTIFRWKDKTSAYSDGNVLAGKTWTYRILTIDKSGNRSSCAARKIYFEPGFRMPLKKVTATANREKKCVEITWESSVEKVFSYQIYKQENDGKFTLIKTLESPERLVYEDRVVNIGNRYSYYVKFITGTGIHSLPSSKIELIY